MLLTKLVQLARLDFSQLMNNTLNLETLDLIKISEYLTLTSMPLSSPHAKN